MAYRYVVAMPPGTTLISGPRDTHFRGVVHGREGDWRSLESGSGLRRECGLHFDELRESA